jgi:hypothetical protein
MMTGSARPVNPSSIEESIAMLEQYLDPVEIAPLIGVLHELARAPEDAALMERLAEVFDGLGILQGAVLTYAPTVAGLLSDDPFAD